MRNYIKILTFLVCTYSVHSQCDYEQKFNNPNDFEIVGDKIEISNSRFNYIDLCQDASQKRAYTSLPNSISDQDCWTAQLKFNPQQVGIYQGQPYTGHLIMSITETSMEPLSDCFDIECTGNPVSSQHSIVISYSATNPPDGNLHYKIIVNKEGTFDVSDLIVNNTLNEEVFVLLEKICNNLVLTLFSDEDFTSMIQNSQVELSIENHRELNYIQHGNTAFGQIERELTGYLDDVCLKINQCIYETIQASPIQICNGQSIEINGEIFDSGGTYQQNLTSSHGCDSIVTLSIIEVQNIQTNESFTLCSGETIEINDEVFDSEGTYQQTLISSQGCDSILNLTIVEVQNIQANESFSFCLGETIQINGEVFDSEGTYQQTLISSQGCDSILNLTIVEVQNIQANESFSFCSGETIQINGEVFDSEGTYQQTLISSQGCDSILNLTIVEVQNIQANESFSFCSGETIQINGEVFDSEGTYQQTLTSSQGCDSILNLTIVEVQNIQANESFSFCSGETIQINGEVFDSEGTYQQTLTSSQGCDSILNIELTILNQSIYIPNIFSSSSIDNRLFKPLFSINNQINYNISIFDRWGNCVFSGQNESWDGRFNGKNVEQGVYVYIIYIGESCFKNPIVGNVTFIK